MSANGNAPTIVRRNHGRNHSYTVNGAKLPGVTTILNSGIPKPAIVKWAARAASQEVLDYWDELAELPPSARAERVRTAPDRDRDAAAKRGTEVHALASRLAAGEVDVPVPDELEGHVDAYLAFADAWDPTELLVEATLANLRAGYCGTLDAIADMGGSRWLLDLKTTRSGVFSESALQLAAYRHAEWVVDTADVVVPMLEVDRCAVVWLKADRTYELVPVDAGGTSFRTFLYALEIGRFLARDDVLGTPIAAPLTATQED
jgi:hypothetical protein